MTQRGEYSLPLANIQIQTAFEGQMIIYSYRVPVAAFGARPLQNGIVHATHCIQVTSVVQLHPFERAHCNTLIRYTLN